MFKKGFVSKWKTSSTPSLIDLNSKHFNPRPWQQEFYNKFNHSNSVGFILNTPTGAGKSKAMCYASSKLLADNSAMKIIIAVPQKNIGSGFIDNKNILEYPVNESYLGWVVDEQNNLCNDGSDESKIATLKSFLELDTVNVSHRPHKRIIVCTHQTLAQSFNGEISLSNTFLWIDEAHHVQTHEEIEELNNKLGGVVKTFLDQQENENFIGLVTATLFRGDSMGIVPTEYAHDFDRYSLPYDKHFEDNCQYLKSFTYDFLLTNNNWAENVCKSVVDGDKSIVFVPHTTSKHSRGASKNRHVSTIIKNLSDKKKHIDMDGVVVTIKRNGSPFNIINLVDDGDANLRQKRVDYIASNKDDIDMIITMNMFTEGSDWDIANKVIIIGVKKSLTQQMQMVGRCFRDHVSKDGKPVSIIQIIPNVDETSVADKDYQNINDYMKCVYSSFIFEMMFNPVAINIKSAEDENGREREEREPVEREEISVVDMFNSETEFFNFFDDAMTELIKRKVDLDLTDKSVDECNEEYRTIIADTLSMYDVNYDNDMIVDYVLNALERRTVETISPTENLSNAMAGIDASVVDFECVQEHDSMDFIREYSTGVCGISTLKEFRNAIISYNDRTWNEMYDALVEYVSKKKELPKFSEGILGSWVNTQKVAYNNNTLEQYKIDKLQNSPLWYWAKYDYIWNKNYNEVMEFSTTNGHLPTRQYNKILSTWITRQRILKNKWNISQELIDLLENIPHWSWDKFEDQWNDTYELLLNYIHTYNCIPPQSVKPVGVWVQAQRNKKDVLPKDKFEKLNCLPNWKWDVLEETWETNFNILKCHDYSTKISKSLSIWIESQRSNYKKNKMSVDLGEGKKGDILIDEFPFIVQLVWKPWCGHHIRAYNKKTVHCNYIEYDGKDFK